MEVFKTVLVTALAYFLGNISPSTLLARRRGIDIKKEGSGNAGASNALRVMGIKAGAITLAVDIFKGYTAVMIGYLVGRDAAELCAMAAFLGHIWPVAFRFKGGKGVAVGFGALLAINPLLAMSCLGVMAVTVLITRMVSAGSIITALSFPLFTYIWEPGFLRIGVPLALVTLYVHRGNMKRIIRGDENRINFKKRKDGKVS